MTGIIRNSENSGTPREEHFDRSKVLENTRLNAQLGASGEALRQELSSGLKGADGQTHKTKYPKTKAPVNLHFDEDDLDAYDEQRGQHEEIIEPKTPYMGTAANTEYYDADEEVPAPDGFALGEAVSDAAPLNEELHINQD